MRNFWISFILLGAVLLTACSQESGASETQPAATATNNPAGSTLPAQATSKPAAAYDPNAELMTCQVVSLNPTPGPTEESMFPPVTEQDWVLGDAESPVLTLIEYSDFQ